MPKNGDLAESAAHRLPQPARGSAILRPGLVAASTGLAGTGHAISAGLLLSGAFITWLVAPAVRVIRRALAERVAEVLGTDFRAVDER